MSLTRMSEHFSLDMLERVAKEFAPPPEPFRPEGPWENRYTLYCLVHNSRRTPSTGTPPVVWPSGESKSLDDGC